MDTENELKNHDLRLKQIETCLPIFTTELKNFNQRFDELNKKIDRLTDKVLWSFEEKDIILRELQNQKNKIEDIKEKYEECIITKSIKEGKNKIVMAFWTIIGVIISVIFLYIKTFFFNNK